LLGLPIAQGVFSGLESLAETFKGSSFFLGFLASSFAVFKFSLQRFGMFFGTIERLCKKEIRRKIFLVRRARILGRYGMY
jgi:hypothetical protein